MASQPVLDAFNAAKASFDDFAAKFQALNAAIQAEQQPAPADPNAVIAQGLVKLQQELQDLVSQIVQPATPTAK